MMYRLHERYTIPGTIKQGYLVKSPPLEKKTLKGWKKRWCMFSQSNGEDPCLNYYHTEEESFSSLPIKRVCLKDCCKVEIDLRHNNYKNIFAIYLPERVYYFSAVSQNEMCEWADTLCSHLNLTRSDFSNKYSTLPADLGSRPLPRTPNSPLPKPPNSPLPRTPDSPLPRTPPIQHRPHGSPLPKAPSSPLPPIPRERGHSPAQTLPHPHSPNVPHHLSTSPLNSHRGTSSTMPTLDNRYSPPIPTRGSQTLPLSSSPLLQPRHHHHHGTPPSPSSRVTLDQQVDTPRRSTSPIPPPCDRVDLRPPAPPPKTVGPDEFNLGDDPPTPPPRKAAFSPPVITDRELFSSDSEEDVNPPQLPPRVPHFNRHSHNGFSP